jgi:hypothetical protein
MVNVLGTRRLKNKPQKKGVLVRFDNIAGCHHKLESQCRLSIRLNRATRRRK